MLSLIGDFLHVDTEVQALTEQRTAIQLHQSLQSNLLFFKKFNPELFNQVVRHQVSRYSVFCTKTGDLNIVEAASGRVLYTSDPTREVQTEVASFCQAAPVVSLLDNVRLNHVQAIETKSVILSFGIGAGLHLEPLLKRAAPSILVIYEAELDLFVSSLHIIDWEKIFAVANTTDTQISLQIGNSGVSIAADLIELTEMLPNLSQFFLYRHLAHPVSDEVFNYLRDQSGQRDKLLQHNRQFVGYNEEQFFVAERLPAGLANQTYPDITENTIFTQNMLALQQFYPALYKIFTDYQPQHWHCVDDNGSFNLWCSQRSGLFYHDLQIDSVRMVERYLKSPLDNQIILNQGGVEKFPSYVHYQAIKKLQPILTNLQPRVFDEHADVDNLIILGVGLGRHIELLLQQRVVKNLFIFEPNIDFFYASLFVTDWATLLTKVEAKQQRFYFNIGGSGDEYFHDIMLQYYQTGAYGIAKSQIFPAFLTPGMRRALNKLQSQLRIIVAMGENFDHVRFGIAHTYQSLCLGHRFLKQHRHNIDTKSLQDIPVFVVGNGPSLDESYAYIKEHREQVIVVSCGTALRSLYRLGITPDFHAEIEQNRATHSWISQVQDSAWLKSIALLSVNGVHPETAALFKSVYLAFKDGESSTNFFRSVLQEQKIHISSLSHAYPTVSNFALDFFSELGFKQLYLLGIDLGYLSAENHHSKHSAYYHNGGEGVMDAETIFASGLRVRGNFRRQVQTKPEFDFSRSILEMTIAKAAKGTYFYNCSDGAYIHGAMPLRPENILINNVSPSVVSQFNDLFDQLFYTEQLTGYAAVFADVIQQYDFTKIVDELLMMLQDVQSYTDAKQLIEAQWQYFIESYNSDNKLGFYLLCGSIIYMLSVLTRLLPISTQTETQEIELKTFNNVLQIWREYLQQACTVFTASPLSCCDIDVSFLFNAPK